MNASDIARLVIDMLLIALAIFGVWKLVALVVTAVRNLIERWSDHA